jgi:protein-tyrosine phosphatase
MQRKLNFDACYNARDLGGFVTTAGTQTRWGAFVRADSLYRLTARGQANVLAHGVRTIIDLRLPQELTREPNPFANAVSSAGVGDGTGVEYCHISLCNPDLNHHLEREIHERGMLFWNYKMLEVAAPEFAQVMRRIAAAPAGGVLFHCFAGKDRTGLIAMFLLALAGVPSTAIAADYDESNVHLREPNEKFVASFDDANVRARVWANVNSGAENMHKICAVLQTHYGGAEKYLLGAGVAPSEIARIRARLVSA